MTLVHIVYVPDTELRGPDLDRMGKVEDLPDELARMMIGDGSGRVPTDEEVAAYQDAQAVEEKAAEAEDLTKLRKDELLKLADERGVADVNESMTKADIAKAIDRHAAQQSEQVADGGPVVTVTPGAGENHDPATESAL